MTADATRRAFRVAYDGREFAGFQRQPHATTVEGTLLRALAEHGILDRGDGPTHATPPGYAAAGRTDAGVSAVAQTVAFQAPAWLTPRAFNGHLPGSIRVWAAADVTEGFHATHDAVRRTYRYHLYAPRTGGDPTGGSDRPARGDADRAADPSHVVDDGLVREALSRLSGEHDFHNLTSDATGTVRDLTAAATRDGDLLVIEVSADGFPRALVRRLVAAVRAVGAGTTSPARIDRLLAPEPVSGALGVGPAPPEPLVLWDVTYDGVSFDVDAEAADSARVAFGERYRTARHVAAATGAIRDRIVARAGDVDLDGEADSEGGGLDGEADP
ncbi:tRNA pseudouridine(38-40) synthase TruA [Halorubrum sp. AD140]|uniref:tRNA pseudouridine(38-40) synthase TruA n=1 Tax=Halorubrum sp. AD140 TaxID=3050073 RepID=UPI002ACC7D9C|nr:tRNA pseudouridine(38-40) synthase TruA [Halorubrum sp. AD140]MDZ5809809.1 tRNA pseudouridine(38-40) synthase TruA [Halorubrum sp. AD140]